MPFGTLRQRHPPCSPSAVDAHQPSSHSQCNVWASAAGQPDTAQPDSARRQACSWPINSRTLKTEHVEASINKTKLSQNQPCNDIIVVVAIARTYFIRFQTNTKSVDGMGILRDRRLSLASRSIVPKIHFDSWQVVFRCLKGETERDTHVEEERETRPRPHRCR